MFHIAIDLLVIFLGMFRWKIYIFVLNLIGM